MSSEALVLASASPRRADLLRWAGVAFAIDPADIDESRRPGEAPIDYALRLSREKALAKSRPGRLSLGADTTVFLGDEIFDKPKGPEEAAAHLRALSGRTHQVVTAFSIARDGAIIHSEAVVSRVTFRQLSPAMIEAYVATGEGLDKAGAYGLQGLGGFLVESISGSYSAVIGLPLAEVLTALEQVRSKQSGLQV